MENFIKYIDDYIKNDTLTAGLITSLLFAVIYDILKYYFFKFLSYSYKNIKTAPKKFKSYTFENLNWLINHYKQQLIAIKKIKNNDGQELSLIIERIYRYLSSALIILFLLLFINMINSKFFYAIFSLNLFPIIKIFYNLIYDYKLIKKAKNYKKAKEKLENQITELQEIMSKIKE